MAREDFDSIMIPSEQAVHFRAVKNKLAQYGLGSLPAKLQPKGGAKSLTNGLVLELALNALEAAMEKKR